MADGRFALVTGGALGMGFASARRFLEMGVGGVFDVMAGNLQRAPLWMRNHRLEWAYRLYLQPSRIGRMAAIPKFMLAIKKWKRKNGNKIC